MSKNFMDAIDETMGELPYNVSITENGAVGYASTRNPILDMNFKVATYRKRTEGEIVNDFVEAYSYNPTYAIKWLFFVRDARQGLGERRLFRVIMNYLAKNHAEVAEKLLGLIAEYGRYDDLVELVNVPAVRKQVITLLKNQLTEDMAGVTKNEPISLLAKWMPSVNTSSQETVAMAKSICKQMKLTEKQYRKMLSNLRAYLKVTEVATSSNEWETINYEAVPSKANLKYKNAFLKHDEERRRKYLDALTKGEAKINSSVNFPHDIVHAYCESCSWYCDVKATDSTLEGLWKALPDYGIKDTLVVADGSGSMCTSVDPNSRTSALEVANALAIYCAEHNQGAFKNKYITFSSKPQLVSVGAYTLKDNLRIALKHTEVANTNIEATFNLILNTAIKNGMSQDEMPKSVLIISDMEFDEATSATWGGHSSLTKTLFDTISDKFQRAGYKLPRLVFWNVASRTGTIPVKQNDLGVALLSGFSPAVVKMVMSDRLDPWECLKETLDSERYAPVAHALA